jgi:hypothetical protein
MFGGQATAWRRDMSYLGGVERQGDTRLFSGKLSPFASQKRVKRDSSRGGVWVSVLCALTTLGCACRSRRRRGDRSKEGLLAGTLGAERHAWRSKA